MSAWGVIIENEKDLGHAPYLATSLAGESRYPLVWFVANRLTVAHRDACEGINTDMTHYWTSHRKLALKLAESGFEKLALLPPAWVAQSGCDELMDLPAPAACFYEETAPPWNTDRDPSSRTPSYFGAACILAGGAPRGEPVDGWKVFESVCRDEGYYARNFDGGSPYLHTPRFPYLVDLAGLASSGGQLEAACRRVIPPSDAAAPRGAAEYLLNVMAVAYRGRQWHHVHQADLPSYVRREGQKIIEMGSLPLDLPRRIMGTRPVPVRSLFAHADYLSAADDVVSAVAAAEAADAAEAATATAVIESVAKNTIFCTRSLKNLVKLACEQCEARKLDMCPGANDPQRKPYSIKVPMTVKVATTVIDCIINNLDETEIETKLYSLTIQSHTIPDSEGCLQNLPVVVYEIHFTDIITLSALLAKFGDYFGDNVTALSLETIREELAECTSLPERLAVSFLYEFAETGSPRGWWSNAGADMGALYLMGIKHGGFVGDAPVMLGAPQQRYFTDVPCYLFGNPHEQILSAIREYRCSLL